MSDQRAEVGTSHVYGCEWPTCSEYAVRRVTFWTPGLGYANGSDYCWEHALMVLSDRHDEDARSEPISG